MEALVRDIINAIDPIYMRIFTFLVTGIVLYISAKKILNRFYPVLQEQNKWYSIKKVVMNTIYVIIFLIFIFTFSDRFQGFYTTLGLAGAGITFALREVIVSIAGWFAIIFGDFFKVGDRVLLGGIKGDVVDLGIFRTTLMEIGDWVNGDQYNGRVVRVSNSFIFTSPVYNYSDRFQFLWDEITVPIRFGSDLNLVREILSDTAQEVIGSVSEEAKLAWYNMRKKFKLEDAVLEHQVFMIFNDNWVEFSLRYVVDMKARRITKNELFTKLLIAFEEQGNSIQLASETFEIVDNK